MKTIVYHWSAVVVKRFKSPTMNCNVPSFESNMDLSIIIIIIISCHLSTVNSIKLELCFCRDTCKRFCEPTQRRVLLVTVARQTCPSSKLIGWSYIEQIKVFPLAKCLYMASSAGSHLCLKCLHNYWMDLSSILHRHVSCRMNPNDFPWFFIWRNHQVKKF